MASSWDLDAPAAEVVNLTKRYGPQTVVDGLSFRVSRGRVTGFLGPNGAGKTTTLRMLLGLAAPTSGEALVFGTPYHELPSPAKAVGALIDASGFHPGRRARSELAIQTAAAGIDDHRIDTVLAEVGLQDAGDKRVGQLSLGMRQRLGLAAALLADPALLVLDEPANGLDPAGMHWLRELLSTYADRGAAVLVSSHVLSELALFADEVVVIHHGHLQAQASVAELVAGGEAKVHVASPDADRLRRAVTADGGRTVDADAAPTEFVVLGLSAAEIGEAAARDGIVLHQLRTEIQSLEEIFLTMTDDEESIR
jgi:ABC-2 type transport system ATP-binding protein